MARIKKTVKFNSLKVIKIIIVTVIAFFMAFGSLLIYEGLISTHRTQFKQFIENGSVESSEIFIFPSQLYTNTSDMQWEDNNRELVIDGRIFDIVCVKNCGTRVMLSLIADGEEDAIKKDYYTQTESSSSKGILKLVKNLVEYTWIEHQIGYSFHGQIISSEIVFGIQPLIIEGYANSLYAPPENWV